jgi:ATP-dependent DNA helicase DinG
MRRRLGLAEERCQAAIVESPFDYAQQAMIYVPRDLPLPSQAEFLPAATLRIVELLRITDGHAFVLFTSHRALREAERHLQGCDWPLLVQGQASADKLIERFRSTPRSVLLGTGTFWAGVDVPGQALSMVIIDKLPFPPPGEPLFAARAKALEESGLDSFQGLSLPSAILTFKQGFGRLIRRRDDRGIVAVLDGRLLKRNYGEAFWQSLPAELARTSALEPLRRFFHGSAAPATGPTVGDAA